MGLVFQLPIPAAILRPNGEKMGRGARFVRRSAKKTARLAAKCEALRVLNGKPGPRWAKARLKAVLFTLKASQIDPDNFSASLKAYQDGICDAGVMANDRGLWPERPEYRLTDKFPRVEITIEPEE